MKKMCPYHKLDILQITQWLNELSSCGWALKKWGIFFCQFEEYEDEQLYYQLDADNWEDGPNKLRQAQLEELGWEYADTIGGTRIHIYKTLDEKATIPLDEGLNEFNRKKYRFSLAAGLLKVMLTLAVPLIHLITRWQFWLMEFMKKDKDVVGFLIIFLVAVLVGVFYDDGNGYRFYKYLERKTVYDRNSEKEQEIASSRIRMPFGVLQWILLVTLLGVAMWMEYGNTKPYVEPFYAERYYENTENFSKTLEEEYNLHGEYWMNVSEDVQEKLFGQIVERYVGSANYYGYTLFKKEKYDTHELWVVEEISDERFDKLVVAEGLGKFLGDGLIFIQMEDDLVYLRYWGERDISTILEKVTEIECR